MFRIRNCRPDECSRVLDLWIKAGTRPTPTDELSELQRVAEQQGDLFLLAEEDSTLVGTLIAGWDGWRGHIYRVAVDPERRRKGVGRALVGEAIKRLQAKGAHRISVLAVSEDVHSTDFWDALADLKLVPDPWPKSRYVADL